MIIDAYTFCYNEEIRLKYYLNLYAPLCRTITIFDNGSTDSSKDIASKYDNVIWETETYKDEINEFELKYLKSNCWKQSKDADWVVVSDVDEILYHKDGLSAYLHFLLNKTNKRIIRATGYDMVSTKLPSHNGNFYDDEEFQYGVKNQDYDKTCIFSPKDVSEINYDWGAHQVSPIALYGPKKRTDKINFLTLYDGELKLLHYKFISKDNYVNRQKTSATRLSENDRKIGCGYQYNYTKQKMETEFEYVYKQRKKVI